MLSWQSSLSCLPYIPPPWSGLPRTPSRPPSTLAGPTLERWSDMRTSPRSWRDHQRWAFAGNPGVICMTHTRSYPTPHQSMHVGTCCMTHTKSYPTLHPFMVTRPSTTAEFQDWCMFRWSSHNCYEVLMQALWTPSRKHKFSQTWSKLADLRRCDEATREDAGGESRGQRCEGHQRWEDHLRQCGKLTGSCHR